MTVGVVFFGERPGPNTDPLRPLYPHTTTGAAARLIGLLGCTTEQYLAGSARYNVFHNGQCLLPLDKARARVHALMAEHMVAQPDVRFVFVGAEALRTAPALLRKIPFLAVRGAVLHLPHTSGVNRWYNSAANTAAARAALAAHLGNRLHGPAEDAQTPPAAPQG